MNLTELLQSPHVGLAEATYRVCVAGRLLPKIHAVVNELAAIEAEVGRDPAVIDARRALDDAIERTPEDPDVKAPVKMGRSVARLRKRHEEIFEQTRDAWPGYAGKRAELEQLNADMKAHEGDLQLRAIEEGEWLRWVAENPPRFRTLTVESGDGERVPSETVDHRDMLLSGGRCNVDALREELGRYIVGWGDETVSDDRTREKLLEGISGGDKNELCRIVVRLHESRSDVPKVLGDLLDTLTSGPVST